MSLYPASTVVSLFDDLEPASGLSKADPRSRVLRPQIGAVKTTSQARLFDEREALLAEDAWSSQNAGFLPSALVQASLPYRDPGDISVYHRTNGNVSLLIQPGARMVNTVTINRQGAEVITPEAVSWGYPYGSIPRLLLAWITTEAITTKSKDVRFGKNMSDFMAKLGSHSISGGSFGSITRLKEQTNRLLSANISIAKNNATKSDSQNISKKLPLTSDTYLWAKGEASPFGSVVRLSDDFYEEILSTPVPLDFRALKYLRASPVALDTYAWLTWTMFSLKSEIMVEWHALHAQFGSNSSERKFRENFRVALQQVLKIYPTANVQDTMHGLVLRASPTHVPVKRIMHSTFGLQIAA